MKRMTIAGSVALLFVSVSWAQELTSPSKKAPTSDSLTATIEALKAPKVAWREIAVFGHNRHRQANDRWNVRTKTGIEQAHQHAAVGRVAARHCVRTGDGECRFLRCGLVEGLPVDEEVGRRVIDCRGVARGRRRT